MVDRSTFSQEHKRTKKVSEKEPFSESKKATEKRRFSDMLPSPAAHTMVPYLPQQHPHNKKQQLTLFFSKTSQSLSLHTMVSLPNQEFIDWDSDKEQKGLSVAVSYETEPMDPSKLCKLHVEETAKEGGSVADPDASVVDLNTQTKSDGMQPVVTDEFLPADEDPAPPSEPNKSDSIKQTDASTTNEQGAEKEANSADKAEAMQPSGKRRGRPLGSTDTRPRATKKLKREDSNWEDLVSEVQQRLSAMDSDECFVKAIGIAMMARKQVESRSVHLVHAFDMLGKNNPPSSSAAAPPMVRPPAYGKPRDPLEPWMEKYMELKHFYHINGHFNVPLDQPLYERLGKWVQHQKSNAATLDTTQLYLLRRINFPVGSHPKPKVLIDLTDHERPQKMKPSSYPPPPKRSTYATEKGNTTQKQVKLHRTTRFQTVETVPCVKMPPPLPPRSDENEFLKQAPTPAFQAVVNFPNARFSGNCVMCDESDFPVPNQNKGVCNNCDSAVWIFTQAGMQLKWCKGCKNFRKWLDFGAKVKHISTFV